MPVLVLDSRPARGRRTRLHTNGSDQSRKGKHLRVAEGDNRFAEKLAGHIVAWVRQHPGIAQPCGPLDPPEPGGSSQPGSTWEPEEPDWGEIRRILSDQDDLFFHWPEQDPVYTYNAYPALEQVFRLSKGPERMGRVYVEAAVAMTQELDKMPASMMRVLRLSPNLFPRVMWSVLFYETLRVGLLIHERERTRARRALKRTAYSLDETVGAEGTPRHELMPSPRPAVVIESDPNLTEKVKTALDSLTPRERQMSELAMEGHEKAAIADLMRVSRPRVSQLLHQVQRKLEAMGLP